MSAALEQDTPTLMTTAEAAHATGLSEDTLLVLYALGIGPRTSMLGAQRVYRFADLDGWRAQPGRSVAELKAGISRVVDALHEVAVTFGETVD